MPDSVKEDVVSRMMVEKVDANLPTRRHGAGFGKPSFKELPRETTSTLGQFVGPDSWFFFNA